MTALDELVAALPDDTVVTDPDGAMLTICENGYGKRTPFGANLAEEPEEDETAKPVAAAKAG